MTTVFKLIISFYVFFATATQVFAATYYVSPSGNDANNGTSMETAWKTPAKVGARIFAAGDQILFEGGQVFAGNLYFDKNDIGTNESPIEVSSYGSGRATISSGAAAGLFAYNTGGFIVRDINFSGDGFFTTNKSGISFYADLAGDVKLPKIAINNVEAKGYGNAGIAIGGWNGTTGYRDVRVTNADLHHNARSGLSTYGHTANGFVGYAHENVYVGHVAAHDNQGIPGYYIASGSGIVLAHVNHAVIEYSVAYNNGEENTHNGGPVGIWAYSSNDVIIQYNESHHNHTNSQADGGGFDLDGGTTNSVMQYNYSHDNDGPGYLLSQFEEAEQMSGIIVRYNISQNDARKNNKGAINIWSGHGPNGINDSQIYNNTVYMSPSGDTLPHGMLIHGSKSNNVKIRNNIIVTSGGRAVYVESGYGVSFENNNYWASGGTNSFYWAGVNYTSLSAWRITHQETANGTAVGYDGDPQLINAGGGITLNNADLLTNLDAYRLKSTSPLIDKGTAQSTFGVTSPSTHDYYRVMLLQGSAYDIGAAEFSTSAPPPPPPPPPAPPTSIAVGSRIQTTTAATVRSKAIIHPSSKKLGTQAAGAAGTVTAGPSTGSGYTWWKVNFDSGADGWVVLLDIAVS